MQDQPHLHKLPSGELRLSGRGLGKLLQAVMDKQARCRFQVKGQSMAPFVRDGDIVTVAPVGKRPLRIGDVVAFTSPQAGMFLVHRVVGKHGDKLLVKGDNCAGPDGRVAVSAVLGRVTTVERDGRRLRFGIGPERSLISRLSRRGVIVPLLSLLRNMRGGSARE